MEKTNSKIALAMIVKDDSEVDILQRCLSSVKDYVDAIFITGTKEPQVKIKKLCKKYHANWSWCKWDNNFSNARNFNFNQVPKDYSWILWLDTDDVVQGANTFKQAIEVAEANNIKAIFARYLYDVELGKDGKIKNILIEHLRERLIRNDGTYEWVAPIHETLVEKVPSGKTDFEGFSVIHLHRGTMEDSMWRNIEILEQNVIDNYEDPRPIYYLAKAYFDTGISELVYEPAGVDCDSIVIELLKDYLRKSGWPEERAQAWEYLSMVHRERKEYEKAIYALLEALKEDPKFTSVYIQLALCYVMLKDWSKALQWVKLAGTVDIPKTTLVINPKDYKVMILEVLFHVYLNTGKLEECEKVANGLHELQPNDLTTNRVKEIGDLKHRNDLAHWIVLLAHHLSTHAQLEQLESLVKSIPTEIADEPAMIDLRNHFIKPKVWGDNEIVIYCHNGLEKWSPKSVQKGIGGSEEAVINMSRELTKLGWKVTVFADPREDAGIYDGINWLPYYYVNWNDTFNILVGWRQIGLVDLTIKANKIYIWNHDIQNPLTYTPERVNKVEKFMFLSKWHRDNVPLLDESKVMITANGI